MNAEKHVTSLEISKKLFELGIKQESVWGLHWVLSECGSDAQGNVYTNRMMLTHEDIGKRSRTKYKAFLSSEIGFLMPYTYQKDNGNTYFIETTSGHTEHGFVTSCSSHFYEDKYQGIPIVGDDFDGNGNEADARAMMLIFLIENNLVNIETKIL